MRSKILQQKRDVGNLSICKGRRTENSNEISAESGNGGLSRSVISAFYMFRNG